MRKVMAIGTFALFSVTFSASLMAQYSQPVRDVENPARSPFWTKGHTSFDGVSNDLSMHFSFPSGKRLVIEYLSVWCRLDHDDSLPYAAVLVSVPAALGTGGYMEFRFGIQKQGPDPYGSTQWIASQPMRLYSDSGTGVNLIKIAHTKTASTMYCDFSLSGYTINTP